VEGVVHPSLHAGSVEVPVIVKQVSRPLEALRRKAEQSIMHLMNLDFPVMLQRRIVIGTA
jgi:hypothetical protein